MKVLNQFEEQAVEVAAAEDRLDSLVIGRATRATASSTSGIVVGELIGIRDEGRTPLVLYPGQSGTAAIPARSIVDLHGPHVGKAVVLGFDGGDSARPIVLGVLRSSDPWPVHDKTEQVEVDADGERLVVTASERLVLRCGKASITLTKAGKVLLEGTYVSSRSSGVQRIRGGSVHIN